MKKEDWKPAFIEAYSESGNVTASAKKAGVSKVMVYKARKKNKTFAAQFAEARGEAADELEGVAFDRAKDHSDTLLIFLLKGLKPETYAERVRNEHSGPGGAPISIKVVYDE